MQDSHYRRLVLSSTIQIKSKTILLQTPKVYTEDILTWKELEFIKGKPKETKPAIMGNPINMYALNGCKNNLITKETKSKLSEAQYNKQKLDFSLFILF